MLLHQGTGYRVKEGYVEIIGGVKLKIIGWDRRYDGYENGEARLVHRDDKNDAVDIQEDTQATALPA
jgi:hypothetical protein